MKLSIVVFACSVRPQRVCLRVISLIKNLILKSGNECTILDPYELKLPMIDVPFHWYPDQNKAPSALKDLDGIIKGADAYIMVVGEYNQTIPPALTNLLDYFSPNSYAYRPAGIVSYTPGYRGACISAVHLRSMLAELGCICIPDILNIPYVTKRIDEDGNLDITCPEGKDLDAHFDLLLTQLIYVSEAMKKQKEVYMASGKAMPKLHPYL